MHQPGLLNSAVVGLLLLVVGPVGLLARTYGGDFRLVARTGQTWEVPATTLGGQPKQATLDNVTRYSMNNEGQVAFVGQSSEGYGVWSEVVGKTAIAADGTPAVGLPTGATNYFYATTSVPSIPPVVRLDDEGRTIFGGLFSGPPSNPLFNSAAFWFQQGSVVSLIAAETLPTPANTPGKYFRQFGYNHSSEINGNPSLSLSSTGGSHFAIEAALAAVGSPSNSPSTPTYWALGPDGPRLIDTIQYQYSPSGLDYYPAEIVVNRTGAAAYKAYDNATGLTLLREQNGLPTAVVNQATIVPGFGTTGRIAQASNLQLNDAGTLGFVGIADAPSFEDEGLFVADSSGQLRVIALEGAPVPGAETAQPFFSDVGGRAFSLRALGPNDEVVFQANETTTAPFTLRRSLWMDDNGTTTRLLSEGDSLPGLTPDEKLKSNGAFALFGNVQVNAQGTIVLTSGFQSPTTSGLGIWALRPGDSQFTPIAISGQAVAMPDGSEGALTSLKLGEINDRGQILIEANYNGGEVLFISNAAATLSDFDGNGTVDGDDLAILQEGFGSANPTLATGDGNGDGVVDGDDFLRWQREAAIAESPAGATGVPEPSSLTLLALATLAGQCSRYRRQARG